MPVLAREIDLYPEELFRDGETQWLGTGWWWVLHTKPRQEKSLARELVHARIPFYLPLIPRLWFARGRPMQSHVPLFPSYLFLLADREQRIAALKTHRVVTTLEVKDQGRLWQDLSQINRLIGSGAPIQPEKHLAPGTLVEIRSGPLAGLKGTVLHGASGRRFVVKVDFIQKGASVVLDDAALTALGRSDAM